MRGGGWVSQHVARIIENPPEKGDLHPCAIWGEPWAFKLAEGSALNP